MSNNKYKCFFKYTKEIKNELKDDLRQVRHYCGKNLCEDEIEDKLNELLLWLRETPRITTIRVNTLLSQTKTIITHLNNTTDQLSTIYIYPNLSELIVIDSYNNNNTIQSLIINNNIGEAIVDAICGVAVLRGANVFAPGIMGLTCNSNINNEINVFADITGQCKKGFAKKYEDNSKLFLGNGILKQCRDEIFLHGNKGSGVAICMKKIVSGLCPLGNDKLINGMGLLQNLPSIICSRILDPQPNEIILDMCAAPGNKTTHIAALMNNQGLLIAIDKGKSKIPMLENKCREFGCKNVKVFCYDSINCVASDYNLNNREILNGPPFTREIFDRILLDGPCSALGQRPQLFNKIQVSELRSFVSLQRKLFTAAVELLKPGGTLVYSTCTITIAENEGIIGWALKKYSSIKLIPLGDKYKSYGLDNCSNVSSGYCIDSLSHIDANKVLRWGPGCDTVGFFIALFKKKKNDLII